MVNEEANLDKMVSDALRGSWVHRFLPQSLWPFAQLARWERPIGWQLLMWPCWWSVMLAILRSVADVDISAAGINHEALGAYIMPNIWLVIYLLTLLFLGAFLMRGAGCTFNDLADVDIDNQVSRTQSRPLPSGRVTRNMAILFLIAQLVLGLAILLQFQTFTIWLGVASLGLVAIYPFMKRITWWPQFFLGLAFSWGALMGWAIIFAELSLAAIALYIGCIAWVIGYDTIYAHQDKEDDALVGVKSTARLFGENSKPIISALFAFALTMFFVAFWLAMPIGELRYMPAYLGLIAGGMHMIWQIQKLDINDVELCLLLFKSNSKFGLIIFTGLAISWILNAKHLAYVMS